MKKLLINIVKKITSFDPNLTKALSLVYSNRRYDDILHYINLRICQTFYKFCKPFNLVKNEHGFFFFDDVDLKNSFSDIAEHMKDNIVNERKQKKRRKLFSNYVLLTNYSFITFDPHPQQLHFDHLPKVLLNKLNFSLERSGIFDECSKIIKTNFSFTQTRSWLFFTNNNKNDEPIGKHYDGLPPGTLKIMYYQGAFTESLPALTLFPKNSSPIKVIGDNPVLIFDSNNIEHGAPFPSKIRPTIELTITPSIRNSYQLIQAGYMAGTKYNPFLKSKTNISVMISK